MGAVDAPGAPVREEVAFDGIAASQANPPIHLASSAETSGSCCAKKWSAPPFGCTKVPRSCPRVLATIDATPCAAGEAKVRREGEARAEAVDPDDDGPAIVVPKPDQHAVELDPIARRGGNQPLFGDIMHVGPPSHTGRNGANLNAARGDCAN